MAFVGRVLSRVPPRVAGTRRELSALVSPVQEFPGLPYVTPQQATTSTPSVSTLSSGLTVVSENASSTTTVSLTFPKGGSASEGVAQSGAALINKCLAFKSGSGLSSALIVRNLEDDGAAPFATADRTSATVGFTCAPEKAVRLIPLLATDCSFEKWDVRDAKALAKAEVEAAATSPQVVLTEQLYAAAYGGQSNMGRPYYSADASTDAITEFRARGYGLKGAVLSATGVADHASFVTAVEERLSESFVGEDSRPAGAVYMGGEGRVHAPSTGYTHVALAMEGPASSVVSNVVKHSLELMGASAFASPGLVGVYGGADSAGASTMVDSLCSAISAPPADVIKRAKGLAKAEAVFALEDGSKALADAMAKSVVESGTFGGVAAAYDEVSDKAVADAFSAMTKSNVSVAAVGDLTYVPYQATIAASLK